MRNPILIMRLVEDFSQNINYSVRDMSKDVRTSLKPCAHTPIYFKKLYPHDKFDLDIASLLQSNPMVTPLMGEFVLRFNVIFQPDSNLYGWYDNDSRRTTDELMSARRHYINALHLPQVTLVPGIYNNPVRHGSLMDFLGVPPMSFLPRRYTNDYDKFFAISADRLLTYLDTVRNYYINRQSDLIYYIYWDSNTRSYDYVSKESLDEFFIRLRQEKDGVEIFDFIESLANEDVLFTSLRDWFSRIYRGGLFFAQYEPDMLRNILYDYGSTDVKVTVNNGTFTIDSLRFQNKLQRLVDRYDISGGRFSSWLRTVWGSRGSRRLDIPQFVGTTSFIIDPNTVTSVADTSGTPDDTTLGQLGGNVNQANYKGKDTRKNTSHYISVDEPGTLMVTVTLVPKVDYNEGIDRDLRDVLFADDYKPEMAQLGFQPVPRSDYSLLPQIADGIVSTATAGDPNTMVGKQIAWMHLMSDVNRVHGEFGRDGYYDTWVLSRNFTRITNYTEVDGYRYPSATTVDLKDIYYANPWDWYYPFAIDDGSLDNFFLQVGFNIRAVRPIGKRYMPTLE